MKTLYILAILFSLSVSAQAPKFELTPQGFTSASDPEQNYLVIESPELDQAQVYKKALTYLHSIYSNPDEALSVIENEQITVAGYAPNSIHRNGMHVFDMDYNYILKFKDGKLRIDAPTFGLTTFTDHKQVLHLVWTKFSFNGSDLGIYGKKDKLKSDRAKEDLENHFNAIVAGIFEAINSAGDDW
ncbi:hypothetical protein [Leeuwenhoekiella marinoflava]|uniref:DUF4468 domain-containing protein n=2 Tax=Leeuwenhoekiella marinoflava TaxID=988 RepID=A0A4Q0PN21_9FLAO|nr:hypothetical protein [Leeuwenhoekiella marinoflava]RXG31811.1 hypothetical protein DSL99_1635 [Leeuwenhoekiella marinoflava]SHF04257.1 hypothetical protein SAMN02745246_01547 [Leeuwenhoekiella marinoflava DSM 3653]